MILGEFTLWCGFTWQLSLPTWGVDVDGLACPLHRPTVRSYQTRGQSLLSGTILSCCCSGRWRLSGDVCDRTILEMRGLSPKIKSEDSRQSEIRKHNTETYNTNIMKLKSSYYTFVSCIRVTRGEAPKDTSKDISKFKRKRTFLRKRTTRHHKSNHLALEVKTLFGTSKPAIGSNTNSSTPPGLPTDGCQCHRRKRERETCTQQRYTKCKA
jgi:hypothetical protein